VAGGRIPRTGIRGEPARHAGHGAGRTRPGVRILRYRPRLTSIGPAVARRNSNRYDDDRRADPPGAGSASGALFPSPAKLYPCRPPKPDGAATRRRVDAPFAHPTDPSLNEVAATAAAWRSQPHAVVERDGVRYPPLGTAHVSRASVDAVREAVASGEFDAVAVELDEQRLAAVTDPDALARLDLVKVLREGKTPLFAANLALASYQRRLAEQLGIEPGAELKAAVEDARARGLPMHLIDRDVGLTFRRALQSLGWWQRTKLG